MNTTLQHFFKVIPKLVGDEPHPKQIEAIKAGPNDSLFIVAGPGSGKTTVLAMRVLKFIIVDEVEPNCIIATTFTRRAAKELRSRILAWGDELRRSFQKIRCQTRQGGARLDRLDFNGVITGTFDSIAEAILAENRAPGTGPPVVVEEFVTRALMLKTGLFPARRHRNNDLRSYVILLRGSGFQLNAGVVSEVAQQVRERFLHDSVDLNRYRSESISNCSVCQNHPHPGISVLSEAIVDYADELDNRGVCDFPQLEESFLTGLVNGTLDPFANRLRAVLVDEYQDTNLLQEQIYFELTRRALANNGGITVVGDDDQSLYRFRGATVDLFHSFPERLLQAVEVNPRTIFLATNYRSTRRIVGFCDNFIHLDSGYQQMRVNNKPRITPKPTAQHGPQIVGLFRDDIKILARDLARLIHDIFCGQGINIPGVGLLQRHPEGSVGDCALLCHSPQEVRSNRDRLPLLLRRELARMEPAVLVFNPRGQNLASVPNVGLLCGLILECVDPNSPIQNSISNLPHEAITAFDRWRADARQHIRQTPSPKQPNSLKNFVSAWQRRQCQGRNSWPGEAHLLDLAYKLVTWIPSMQDDIEGLFYLEAIVRAITQSSHYSNFRGHILFDSRQDASIRSSLWDIFVPIAMGTVEVEEDLLETLPRDRLNILSTHQAKGLEFPMVVVDVGSDFRSDHHTQRKFRFPDRGDLTHNLEDELRQFSPLGPSPRSGEHRAFDDLIRLYFVAFSRAQDLLVLVGLSSVREGIPNVATGWDRNSDWHWAQGLPNLLHI